MRFSSEFKVNFWSQSSDWRLIGEDYWRSICWLIRVVSEKCSAERLVHLEGEVRGLQVARLSSGWYTSHRIVAVDVSGRWGDERLWSMRYLWGGQVIGCYPVSRNSWQQQSRCSQVCSAQQSQQVCTSPVKMCYVVLYTLDCELSTPCKVDRRGWFIEDAGILIHSNQMIRQ